MTLRYRNKVHILVIRVFYKQNSLSKANFFSFIKCTIK